jgi:serine/threonine protein kinase
VVESPRKHIGEKKQMRNMSDWERIEPLGSGGQSNVFLVRTPARKSERQESIGMLKVLSGMNLAPDNAQQFAAASWNCARPELPSELGALKVFKIPPEGSSLPPPPGSKEFEAIDRLKNEIAALDSGIEGLPKLLDSNVKERWIVTEYFPERTLEHHPLKYKGKVPQALRAFRSLVETVASLHGKGYVHRDIKPANVFIRNDEKLVLGDFGIVYVPNAQERVTLLGERVGPRDYMPQWANLGERHEKVRQTFDMYMLGKLLWSMVDGRAVLPREYHKHPEHNFDLTKNFPNDPNMPLVNSILDGCVVEQESECRISNAQDLLLAVNTVLQIIERRGQLLKEGVPRPCHVCGLGSYQSNMFPATHPPIPKRGSVGLRFWIGGSDTATVPVYPFVCDYCGHVELFTRPSPGNG